MRHLKGFATGTAAATALDYAILAGVIVVAIAAALAVFAPDLVTVIERIGGHTAVRYKDVGS